MPAGGFESALASIEGGADALYLGFSDFSARRQAKNFDRLEYRRLHRLARERGVKLYAALNTVLLQGELGGAARLLAFLGRFPPDAIIVQDWGLAALIRERHPGIAIHASTQAAVQGAEAARIARELGASRIVLPRETSLEEMRKLSAEEGGLELEAFVHGALCYSFSGLCLASGLVLGRSGNRGECAQLCRSYYRAEAGELKDRTGYWFSCRDLDLSESLRELAEAGICSLKVEGRMKSPEYCYAVARLYRGALDGLEGRGPGIEEMEARRDAARIAFSRSPSEGWLRGRGGERLIDSSYPGHRGLRLGRVAKVDGPTLELELERPLGLRDGLLGFERSRKEGQGTAQGLDESRPLRFPALELRDAHGGRELVRARAGSRVSISVPTEGGRGPGTGPELRPGDEIRIISSREQDKRVPSPEEYEPDREDLILSLELGEGCLAASLELPGCGGGRGAARARIEAAESLPMDRARAPGGFERAIGVFSESGEADFRLAPEFDAEAAAWLFVPPSALKREKNRIYALAAGLVADAEAAYAEGTARLAEEALKALGDGIAQRAFVGPAGHGRLAPPRSALSFRREGLPAGMPFALPRDLSGREALPSWEGRSYLPLAPLVADRELYAGLVKERVSSFLSPGGEGGGGGSGNAPRTIVVGLGALHHIALARELLSGLAADSPEAVTRMSFFLDFNLYVANAPAFASLSSLLPRVEFAYRYVEEESLDRKATGAGPDEAAGGPLAWAPLFQSLGCLKKHHLHKGSCPDACGRSWSADISDRDRRYRIIVEDCVSYVFGDPRAPVLRDEPDSQG